MDVIGRIQVLRDEIGLTNREVETGAGIAASSLSQWKRGKGKPCLENIIRLSEFFHVSTDYLLGLSDNKEREKPDPLFPLSEEEILLLVLYREFGSTNRSRLLHFCMKISEDKTGKTAKSQNQSRMS